MNGSDPSGPFENPLSSWSCCCCERHELLSLLQASRSACRPAQFWGSGGRGRRGGDSGVEPSERHDSSAGCHEATSHASVCGVGRTGSRSALLTCKRMPPTRLCDRDSPLGPISTTDLPFHSGARRPRMARVKWDFQTHAGTLNSCGSFTSSVLLASLPDAEVINNR